MQTTLELRNTWLVLKPPLHDSLASEPILTIHQLNVPIINIEASIAIIISEFESRGDVGGSFSTCHPRLAID